MLSPAQVQLPMGVAQLNTLASPGWRMQIGELTPLQLSHVVPHQFKYCSFPEAAEHGEGDSERMIGSSSMRGARGEGDMGAQLKGEEDGAWHIGARCGGDWGNHAGCRLAREEVPLWCFIHALDLKAGEVVGM